MPVKISTIGLVTIIAALAIALTIKSCERPPETSNIPPALAKTLDSLSSTQPLFEQHRDSVIRVVVHDTVHAAASNARAETALAASNASQKVADSLAALAAVRADSASLWHGAYDAQRRTSDSLRVAVASKDSAYRDERANRIRLFSQLKLDSARTNAIQDANDRLTKRIGELEQPCRIIGPIPCPSRTATMVLTTLAIVGGEAAAKR